MPRHPTKLFRYKHFPALKKPVRGRIYLFMGFGGLTATYSPAILRLCNNGFSVVAFSFSVRGVLGFTIENLPVAINDICKTVETYEAKRTDSLQTISFGNSMGSVFAWHTAQRVKSIDKVVANTGYALISKMIFEYKQDQTWYKQLVKDGYDEQSFHKAILDCEPITHFDKLKGKKILLFMNRNDNVISFSHAKLFKDALEQNNITYTFVESHDKTHGRTITKNLFSKQLIEFLTD